MIVFPYVDFNVVKLSPKQSGQLRRCQGFGEGEQGALRVDSVTDVRSVGRRDPTKATDKDGVDCNPTQ